MESSFTVITSPCLTSNDLPLSAIVRTPGCVKWRLAAFSCETVAFALEVPDFALEAPDFALEVPDFAFEAPDFALASFVGAAFPAGFALALLAFALVLDRPSFEATAF